MDLLFNLHVGNQFGGDSLEVRIGGTITDIDTAITQVDDLLQAIVEARGQIFDEPPVRPSVATIIERYV